ncbi:Indole-3-glycerol phosphate synthase [Prochlorococcus marinus str. MIT 9515]|uniref:Indole-3-glycerol phosphate synthase n=1 Tax=Prochlorococcus marinus (strain MIT 9515) TaxID=167542 RepID=TRPC_PROM5|nr:indole-3-glycerol phosphate synthase TrpC [Prochlorococcus marinus]A2BY04.1 RecName: Full=Indole-3-glycerol phosphate synthase; Short=IGPS [Prochlorococcus marinus str. MIT 9515]ABM72665.1 Indole-3-glycerol phosphate synthase [Prochlorococcus marinus str. MIT 9515]
MEIRRRPPNPTVRVENLEYAVPHREAKAKNILEEIVWYKDIEIKNFKKIVSLEDLIKKLDKLPPTKDFGKSILQSKIKPGVIAEIKKASPSKGVIREDFRPNEIAFSYERSGASCISVLTDKRFFQGSYEILQDVRGATNLPLLCKDFIISAYQIYKARVSGADAILLIAAILSDDDLFYLKKIADNLGMSVLVEVHDEQELKRILSFKLFDLIGINNRDLKTFKTDLKTSIEMMSKYSDIFSKHNIIPISESGINNSEELKKLVSIGIKGVLIGERFMRECDIEHSFKKLFKSI